MTKKPIDYSRTFAYMLCCKYPTITDVYVGHTTNLTKRKNKHKYNTNNPKSEAYNLYVYQFIRENGGWENWEMIVLETKSCIDGYAARKFEREWFEKKSATLNGQRPFVSEEERIEKMKITKKIYHQEHKDQLNEGNRQYYYEHQKELCEKAKIYYGEHRDKVLEYQKTHRIEHKDEIIEYKKKYYQENKDVIAEKGKQFYQENKDVIAEKRRQYRQENKDEINRKAREKRALKKLQKESEVNLSV